MAGRAATDRIIRGRHAISVNDPGHVVPHGWERVPLSDVAELGTGHTPSRSRPAYWDGGVPWIGIRDAGAHHGRVIEETAQTVSELGLANSAARLLPKDTVCLSRTASVGYVVKMGRKMATSQDFVTWSCLDPLDPDYLMSALLAEGQDIRRFGEGSTHTTIYFPEVRAFYIDLPPKAEQRRIVAKLDALTARLTRARAELDRVPMLANKLRESVLLLAESGSLSTRWRIQHPKTIGTEEALYSVRRARTSLDRPIRRIPATSVNERLPNTWTLVSPDEIASDDRYSIGIGPFGSNLVKSDYRTAGVRLVFVRDIRSETYGSVGARYVDPIKGAELVPHLVSKGDLLVTKMGDPPGDSSVYPNEENGIITADCIKLRPDARLADVEYLRFCIRFPVVQRQIGAATKGVAQQKISLDQFRRMALPLPPVEEQREITQLLNAAFARAARLEAEAARARALLDRLESAILAKAFRGELVPQDPNDEPASVLLDRIRAERAAAPKAKRGRAKREPA